MRRGIVNTVISLTTSVFVGLIIMGLYYLDTTPEPEPYHIAINCGDMGTYMVQPGTLEAAQTPGMLVGVLMNGQVIKLPKQCVAYTVSAPDPKITYNNNGDQGA